ncbi:glycoside hydrolase family 3 protein [Neobacillus niacini]|uniref:glycoside hydrolase family 3 protein n=1 Tax=Neobacillus niacini TaxID=86668 RepID=UPI002FFDAD6B
MNTEQSMLSEIENKTRVVTMGEITYDIDDFDGPFSMLNRSFIGCLSIPFSKRMNEEVIGKVSVEGTELKQGTFYSFTDGFQLFLLPVIGVLSEYDKTYSALFEGFVDEDGHMMELQEITIKTLPKKLPVPGYEKHEAKALETAREGIVLLKNENDLLPLKKTQLLNVFGKGLFQFRLGATGAGRINPRYQIGMITAIKEYSNLTLNPELETLYQSGIDILPSEQVLNSAYEQSDIAVITITRMTGENIDNSAVKGEFYLTDEEEAMIQAISGTFSKTIAIINTGYPIDVSWVEKYKIKACVYCGYPGMLGGKALVEILDGRVNPSAKLPDTWSVDYYDNPASKNFYNAVNGNPVLYSDAPHFIDTYYEEDIFVGYRYYETFKKEVAYPFGYGLSYTTFDIEVTGFQYEGNTTQLNVKVTNIGSVPGKEVIQIFVKEPDGKIEKASKKLVAFSKTNMLKPGETQKIAFDIQEQRFTSYDSDTASWIMEKGTYRIYAGNSVKQLVSAGVFELNEDKIIRKVTNLMQPPVEIPTLSKKAPEGTYPTGELSGIKQGVNELEPTAIRKKYTETDLIQTNETSEFIKYTDVIVKPELLGAFIKQLTIEELARLSVCASHGWGMHEKGEAGRVFLLEQYDMKDFVVADGNHGVNVKKPNIGMPASVNLCSTFNTELAYEVGRVIAEEAKEHGVHMILAPGMNLHRNPLNGRHPEYFSEDPYLAGMMAGHMSKGLEENGVSSCLKHTVANNCESARKRNQSLMTERALRELYLKSFEVAIEVHNPDAIMTGYNAVNGVFTAEDEEMIQGIFRDEFGFEGFVMTDWNSYDTADIVAAVQAGNSWMTPGSRDNTFVTPIIEGIQDGKIDRLRLEKNVMYLIRVMLKRAK